MKNSKIIFFGNGPLADHALAVLKNAGLKIIFHARSKQDLETVKTLKTAHPEAHGILASFGVIIKSDVLDLFEPEGILNIHPSLLPELRGPSPIETAILNGDTDFSISIMKLVKAMDAGPIYYQTTLSGAEITKSSPNAAALPAKSDIYAALATAGAVWIVDHLEKLPLPAPQDDAKATFTQKLTTSLSWLKPSEKVSESLLNEIRAFAGFPKSKYELAGLECTILDAHISDTEAPLSLECADGKYLVIDRLQPASKKPMDAKSFQNGYMKKRP